ncbi:MAG: GNAT family N-acetyltransferase [Pseudomonadota bacterium]
MALTPAPRLETDRLILRGPERGDVEPIVQFFLEDRSEGFGGPMPRSETWRWFNLNVGHWHWHGYGHFTITVKETGTPAGMCGIWNPDGWPEPELGWLIYADFEGKGIAFEAAARARDWAYRDLGFTTLSSHIIPGNTRSVTLAERLGAVYESSYDNPHMGEDQIYRHPPPDVVLG